MPLDPRFLEVPLAHRGLHDKAQSAPENSPGAFRRAIAKGYGIELDCQVSADGQAMVFHDRNLDRLTDCDGPVNTRSAAELGRIKLKHSSDFIPTLATVLSLIDAKVPVLIEIKDQDGAFGENIGPLSAAIAGDVMEYPGPVAVMSFNPNAVAAVKQAAPNIETGLVTRDFLAEGRDDIPPPRRRDLTAMSGLGASGAAFISHDRADLASPVVARVKNAGMPILCWTVRSPTEEEIARNVADNITFEGYLP